MRYLLGLLLIIALPIVSAATITGTVYDFSLEPVEAIIEIDTTPIQKVVAKGPYSIEVPPGTYTLTAKQYLGESVLASTQESIEILQDGEFIIDLILFPDAGVEDLELEEPIDPSEIEYESSRGKDALYLIIFIIVLAIIGFGMNYSFNKNKMPEELDDDAKKVLEFITDHKRVTQKDIRKEFPHSQAKISLILTELEDKELIRKIKKGRGNIIIRN
ncbi:hypothetical protein ACFL1B_01925 [Nanoarchaeota archaeon]